MRFQSSPCRRPRPASPRPATVVAEAPLRAHLSCWPTICSKDAAPASAAAISPCAIWKRRPPSSASNRWPTALPPAGQGGRHQAAAGSFARFTASNGKILTPAIGPEILFGTMSGKEDITIDAPLVFVGYGAVARKKNGTTTKAWTKGKILVMMVNDPQPTAEEPNRFAGKAYTYYGRWMYKYEEALRQGAAGALLIHTTPSASYDWSVPATSFSHERFHLAGSGNPLEGWLQEETARAVRRQRLRPRRAARPGRAPRLPSGRPQAQDARAIKSKVRQIEQYNVVGIVPGTDARLKSEAVVYSAHWDHLGIDESKQGDNIWNGAIDNASGVAALLAMAQAAVSIRPSAPRCSCGRPAKTGFLGSNAYIRNPAWPLDKTTADLNLDSMNFVGKTRDIGVPAPSAAACTRRPRWWQSAWA
jgi:hypothetical protein